MRLTVSASPWPMPMLATAAKSPLDDTSMPYGRSPALMSRLVYSTFVPSTESTEILLSPSRVTSAIVPSGVKTARLVPDLLAAIVTVPAGGRGLLRMVHHGHGPCRPCC